MVRPLVALAPVLVAVWLAPSGRAVACDFAAPEPFMTSPEEVAVDRTAPAAPAFLDVKILRGQPAGCDGSNSSCDDTGTITIKLSAHDDRTPTENLGYRVSLIAGKLPAALTLPRDPVKSPGGLIWLHWNDGAERSQEELTFTLAVRAVDLAGNESPATEIPLHDGERLGCALGGTRVSGTPLLFLLVLGWLRLQRARTSKASSSHLDGQATQSRELLVVRPCERAPARRLHAFLSVQK